MDNRNNTKDGFVLILIAAVAFAYFSGRMSIMLLTAVLTFGFALIMGVNHESGHAENTDDKHAVIHIKSKPTVGGVICEVIAAGLLIASWILGIKQHLFNAGDGYFDLAIVILTSTTLWFLVSTYFPASVGESCQLKNHKQFKLSRYRNRAMAIVSAIAAVVTVTLYGQQMDWLWWLLIFVLIILYFSKYYINKKA